MGEHKYDIFISYRRDGGESTAKTLRDRLASLKYRVFFDVESLRSGDFNTALFSVIEECRDFLLILSPGALDRCKNDNDWVRMEIEHALKHNLNIIPVMLRGFEFPEELPPSIEAIRYRNGLEPNYQFFDAFIEKLQTFLASKPARPVGRKLGWIGLGAAGALAVILAAGLVFSLTAPSGDDIPADAQPTALTAQGSPLPRQETPMPASETPVPPAPSGAADAVADFSDWSLMRADIVSDDSPDKWVLGKTGLARSSVSTVTFLNTLADRPQDAWDVSAQGDASVMAWAVPADKGGNKYELYIAAEGNVGAESCESLFAWYDHLTKINFNHCFYTGRSKSMSKMFYKCERLQELDLSDFRTELVSDMSAMFSGCSSLASLGLQELRTGSVKDMGDMFVSCEKLEHLDLSAFRTDSVENMRNMFGGCSSLKTVDLSSFNTAKVKNMRFMFNLCSALEELDLGSFRTDAVKDMYAMFSHCSSLTKLDLHNFKTDNVEYMGCMFLYCNSLKELDLSGFGTGGVKYMEAMFDNCSSLARLDLHHFDTGSVKNMRAMFQSCYFLEELDLGDKFVTGNVTDMSYMFSQCNALKELNLSGFDTGSVTAMRAMFHRCYALTALDLSAFRTEKVQDMSHMFSYCSHLESIDVGSFRTGEVTDMSDMFRDCSSLKELDLSGFDMGKVANRENMLAGAAVSEKETGLPLH